MTKSSLLSIGCAVFVMTACDHYSQQLAALDKSSYEGREVSQIAPAAGGMIDNRSFSGHLLSEYTKLARYEQDHYDYKAANYYTKKAKFLSEGKLVSPASIKEFNVPANKKEEFIQARENLITALKTYNIPSNRYALAKAQTQYDCWLEQEEESLDGGKASSCQNDFVLSLASLHKPDAQGARFSIPFDSGSMVLGEDSRNPLAEVLSFWKNNIGQGNQVILSPAAGISAQESARQTSIISSILQFNGVPAADIHVQGDDTASAFLDNAPSDSFEIIIQPPVIKGVSQGDAV